MTVLASAFGKIAWANEHLEEFKRSKQAFHSQDPSPYRVHVQFEAEELQWVKLSPDQLGAAGAHLFAAARNVPNGSVEAQILVSETVGISMELVTPLPHVVWGVMVGNIIHNLRSALDNLVWELSVRYQASLGNAPPVDPIPRGSPWRAVQFPICTTEASWNGWGLNCLKLVAPELITVFKELQPWYSGQINGRDPNAEWPAALQELWNRDKHRTVAFVACNVAVRDIVACDSVSLEILAGWETEVLWAAPWGPFENGTQVARARIAPLIPRFDMDQAEMTVRCKGSFDIAFAQGPPAYGAQVANALERMSDSVATVLIEFQPKLA